MKTKLQQTSAISAPQTSLFCGPAQMVNDLGHCARCKFPFERSAQFQYTGKGEKVCRSLRECQRRGGLS
jgi:hypothetical protein